MSRTPKNFTPPSVADIEVMEEDLNHLTSRVTDDGKHNDPYVGLDTTVLGRIVP